MFSLTAKSTMRKCTNLKSSQPDEEWLKNVMDDLKEKAGGGKEVPWTAIEEAPRILLKHGGARYKVLLESILAISKPIDIIVESGKFGTWEYGNGDKETDLIPWEDLKPYVERCRIVFQSDNPK